MLKVQAKPIDFKFNEYISKGVDLLKKDFGNVFLAFFFCIVMSIIPFCSFLAVGNFYKYCRRLNKGQQASPGDIFNFDDFTPYFILQLILIGGIFLLYIPMFIMIPVLTGENGEPSTAFFAFFIPYLVILSLAILIITLKGFYIPALISFGGIKEVKTAWNMSVIMGKNNLLSIFLFSLVISIIGQLGILLCGIGIFFTLPLVYTAHYFAYEDAMQQIEYDEIKEIGSKNEY